MAQGKNLEQRNTIFSDLYDLQGRIRRFCDKEDVPFLQDVGEELGRILDDMREQFALADKARYHFYRQDNSGFLEERCYRSVTHGPDHPARGDWEAIKDLIIPLFRTLGAHTRDIYTEALEKLEIEKMHEALQDSSLDKKARSRIYTELGSRLGLR